MFYLVKWKGFTIEESTWQRESELKMTIPDVIEEFELALTTKNTKETEPNEQNGPITRSHMIKNDPKSVK